MILRGRAVALIGVGAIAAIFARDPYLMLVFTASVVIMSILDWAIIPHPRQLVIEREKLPSVRLSQSLTTRVHIINAGKRRIQGIVRDSWQPSAGAVGNRHPINLAGGEATRVATVLRPTRRGHLTSHWLVVRARSIIGLTWRQASLDLPSTLKVLPEFKARRHLPSRLARLRELDGQVSVLVRGEGTEFDSLRDYVDGDDVRSIDWRATARKQDLVVRTWRPERDRQVVIVLDTSRLAAARLESETRLDAGIETTLLMAALANHAGDQVHIIAIDRRIRAQVSETRGAATMSGLAEALGPLEPDLTEPDWPLVARTVSERAHNRSLIVLCTAVEPGALGSGLITAAEAMARTHQVVVASASDPTEAVYRRQRDHVEEVFIAAAAERADADRSQVADALSRSGIHVIQAPPDTLAPAVADHYLALKAAGRL